MVVGSGLFGLPGLAIQAAGPQNALLGWVAVIAIMPAMIHIFAFLGRKHPESGGIALYAGMGFGRWSKNGILMLTVGALLVGMPAFFLVGGSYAASLLSLDSATWTPFLAILLAILTTIANACGIRQIGWFNTAAIALTLAVIAFVLFRAMPYMSILAEAETWAAPGTGEISSVWLAAGIVFWAFQGWENLTFGFGEIKEPNRNIPQIFWISFFVVVACYLSFAAAVTTCTLAGHQVSGLNGLASLLPFGVSGKIILSLMVIILIANANSWVFGASRAFYSAAKLGALPSILAKQSGKGIPVICLISALAAYIIVISVIAFFKISPEYAFLATTQGFIILYGGAILAYVRKTQGLRNKFISSFAALGWLFLTQGFGILILYSLLWFLAGIVLMPRADKQLFG